MQNQSRVHQWKEQKKYTPGYWIDKLNKLNYITSF